MESMTASLEKTVLEHKNEFKLEILRKTKELQSNIDLEISHLHTQIGDLDFDLDKVSPRVNIDTMLNKHGEALIEFLTNSKR